MARYNKIRYFLYIVVHDAIKNKIKEKNGKIILQK